MASVLGELRRRRVFKVGATYAVVAWLLLQVVDVVNDPLSLPPWFDTVAIVLVVMGLPLAVVLAWMFDVTPSGVVRTAPGDDGGVAAEVSEARAPGPVTASSALEHAAQEVLRNSVAVLPLENLSPNPDDAFFAAGIHEEILNQLAKIKDLSVIARTSVKKYRDTEKTIAEIAAELGVGTVVEGSVRYAGERVRVTAQLIDAASENHLWSEVYERDLADVFAIQADVATKIASALEAELSVFEKRNVEKLPTDSPEAYALYLRALAIHQEYGHWVGASPGSRSGMQSYLDEAIALDPDFALAYVARAQVSASRLNQDPGVYEESANRRAELETLALRDVERALTIDPGIGQAYGILARIHQFNWRGAEARKAYRRALELSPSDPVALMGFATFCAMTGDRDQALELASRQVRLDPNSGEAHAWLAVVHLYRGDRAAALGSFRRAVELAPTLGMVVAQLADLEAACGNESEALRQARIAEELLRDTANPVYPALLAQAYARLGRVEDVQRLYHDLEELAQTRRIPGAAWIIVFLALGDSEQALHWLNATADDPEPYVGHYGLMLEIKANAVGIPILEEPRFRAARERLGFRD